MINEAQALTGDLTAAELVYGVVVPVARAVMELLRAAALPCVRNCSSPSTRVNAIPLCHRGIVRYPFPHTVPVPVWYLQRDATVRDSEIAMFQGCRTYTCGLCQLLSKKRHCSARRRSNLITPHPFEGSSTESRYGGLSKLIKDEGASATIG